MIKAVLLDLDNTLLSNPDESFAQAYLSLAERFFHNRWGITDFSRVLLQSIRDMAEGQRNLQRTNLQIALDRIAAATGKPQAEISQAFDEFYRVAYPELRRCVQPVEIAAPLVDLLRQRHVALVIATNPFYPPEAIRQRLAWAGLPDDFGAYALVTHAANMHFIKPDPAYYAEIVARVGVEPDEAIMVGDSPRNDIQPAHHVGLYTYHVHPGNSATDESGALEAFFERVQSPDWLDNLIPTPLTPDMIVPEMRGNIGALFGTLSDVKPHYWMQHPDPDEWSLLQILCHLLETEVSVHRARLERIRAEDNPFIANPKPPPGPREAVSCDESGWNAARRFTDERLKTIDWLRGLQADEWRRPARHSIFGLTTLLEMAHFTAQHDRLHINQLCQTLGRCQ